MFQQPTSFSGPAMHGGPGEGWDNPVPVSTNNKTGTKLTSACPIKIYLFAN